MLVVIVIAGVELAVATVPAKPFAEATDTVVTVPAPAPPAVASASLIHCEPLYFSTCPVLGLVIVTSVNPSKLDAEETVIVPPRLTLVPFIVILLLVNALLPILDMVFDAPLMVLLVNVWAPVNVLTTAVSMPSVIADPADPADPPVMPLLVCTLAT